MRTVFWSSASVLHNYLPWPGERALQPRIHCVKTRYLAYERGLVKRNQFAKVLMRLQQIIIITERPAICHLNVTIIFSVAPPFRVSHLESAEKGGHSRGVDCSTLFAWVGLLARPLHPIVAIWLWLAPQLSQHQHNIGWYNGDIPPLFHRLSKVHGGFLGQQRVVKKPMSPNYFGFHLKGKL